MSTTWQAIVAIVVVVSLCASLVAICWIMFRATGAPGKARATVVWEVTEENRRGLPIAHGKWRLEVVDDHTMRLAWQDPTPQAAPVTDDRS